MAVQAAHLEADAFLVCLNHALSTEKEEVMGLCIGETGRILYTCFQSIQAQKSSEYERIEIPIHVVPHNTIGKVCLESAVELPKILCQEEQDAYRKIHSLTHLDSITKIHNGSVFTKNLCSQMSAISGPLLQWLEDRLEQNKQRMQELQREKEELLEELSTL
ncbi:PREDICTED: lys-63-specific deubiquitinase BRCC36 [Gekko japonicus]|uniref:Lys-63-specific deubiquitinase BRCC36 n=1 Tax=Gekko japonicus TaxID=146911 RepID=A0ABM1L7S2_GEKJA|nr:PREDICTED: lys-63-specific deubiquitinase BRCC36 [Gekko japonicus]